jgi:hypothetical protein
MQRENFLQNHIDAKGPAIGRVPTKIGRLGIASENPNATTSETGIDRIVDIQGEQRVGLGRHIEVQDATPMQQEIEVKIR